MDPRTGVTMILNGTSLDPTFFPGRAATVHYRELGDKREGKRSSISKVVDEVKDVFKGGSNDRVIGVLGILHPAVLENFEIGFPCSALELNLEPFKKEVRPVWVNP
jgi:phenylalanyl-tRNA synthetase beta chain